ncbi:MAG: hypothetical protein IKQ15_08360 [Kiritimatiellae bacterium]|nr:hypothetical protein [Kiritimatiellia bacterium]
MSKAMRTKVLAVLVEVPAEVEKVYTRPDEAGREGAFEYRLGEWQGAAIETEYEVASEEGMETILSWADARAATKLLQGAFITRKQAAAIRRILAGEAES